MVCLCRTESDEGARRRVTKSLARQRIHIDTAAMARLECYASDLSKPILGLDQRTFTALVDSTVAIFHAAWPVHFEASLSSFVPHFEGEQAVRNPFRSIADYILALHNLIDLASRSPGARFFFCSSTASILGATSPEIPERVSRVPEDAVAMGYARSKHVAECMCDHAWKQGMERRVGILRLGQLCGDTINGVWKAEEGWPLLISSAALVGCLPDLHEASLSPT